MSKVIRRHRAHKGFTIIEVLTVVVVIGILATIGVVSYIGVQKNTRDSQRTSQITVIAEALEKYYDKNGEYPDCTKLDTEAEILSTIDVDSDILIAPKSTSESFKCDDQPSTTNDVFCYNFDVDDGSWDITYFNEKRDETVVAVHSRRIMTTALTSNAEKLATPQLTATANGAHSIDLDWSPYASNSDMHFFINYSTDGNFPDSSSTSTGTFLYNELSYQLTNLSAGTRYYIRIRAISDNGDKYGKSDWSETDNAITDPEYTMTASASPIGTGTISGVVNPYSINNYANITAHPNSDYKFSYWENCSSSTVATINLIMDGNKTCIAHFTAIATYTLKVLASPVTAATMSGGENYKAGTTVNPGYITNNGYTFDHWSAGCSSSFSMPADNLTCTANFKINAPTITGATETFNSATNTSKFSNITFLDTAKCPTGTTAKYEYNKTIQAATNDWRNATYSIEEDNTVGWKSMNLGTFYYFGPDGFTTQASIRAQCISDINSDIFSEWSEDYNNFASHIATVLSPTPSNYSTTFSPVMADNKYTLNLWIETKTAPSCHSVIENGVNYPIYLASRFDVYGNWNPNSSTRSWYADSHSDIWWSFKYGSEWLYAANPVKLSLNIKNTDGQYIPFTTGDRYGAKRQYKCYNPYTTKSSDPYFITTDTGYITIP